MGGFQIVIRIRDGKVNKKALAQQIANLLESFTGKRTIVNVGGPGVGR